VLGGVPLGHTQVVRARDVPRAYLISYWSTLARCVRQADVEMQGAISTSFGEIRADTSANGVLGCFCRLRLDVTPCWRASLPCFYQRGVRWRREPTDLAAERSAPTHHPRATTQCRSMMLSYVSRVPKDEADGQRQHRRRSEIIPIVQSRAVREPV
jgi:hypothetical protein